ncbi:SitI3 family protein [Streptomyces sp. NPDC101234]|uniref:SitI3 family protein n=1 Tax=Streptomyces sp. NPDC101234 TaxID=3366138 RepID=UPI00380432B9
MAFSYTLGIATSTPTSVVAERLAAVAFDTHLLGSAVPPAELLGEGIVTLHGTWLRVIEEDEEPDPDDPLVKSPGIAASTIVIFRHKKNVFPEEQDDDVVLLTSRLLEQVPGDAVLHLGYETAKLVRRAGRTSLSNDTELWTAHRLALISQDYDRTTYRIDQGASLRSCLETREAVGVEAGRLRTVESIHDRLGA